MREASVAVVSWALGEALSEELSSGGCGDMGLPLSRLWPGRVLAGVAGLAVFSVKTAFKQHASSA